MSISRRLFFRNIFAGVFFYATRTLASNSDDGYSFYLQYRNKKWLKRTINIESFYIGSDNGDYYFSIVRGLKYCAENGCSLLFSGKYKVTRTIELDDNTYILGTEGALLYCNTDEPITIFLATGKKNINIKNLSIDGMVSDQLSKNYTRLLRFINCEDISISSVSAGNSADWCFSFEDCQRIKLSSIVVYGGGRGRPGGRDGIHFLNCSYFYVDGADITSGDDCIGITTLSGSSYFAYINNITGSSEIGSIVACNEEQKKDKTYYRSAIGKMIINNIKVKPGGNARNIVRFFAYNNSTDISDITLSNINGVSNNYGVYIGGVNGLSLNNIKVLSRLGHAIYLVNSENIVSKNLVIGSSRMKGFYGVSLFKCKNIFGKFQSQNYDGAENVFISKSENIQIK